MTAEQELNLLRAIADEIGNLPFSEFLELPHAVKLAARKYTTAKVDARDALDKQKRWWRIGPVPQGWVLASDAERKAAGL